MSKADFRRFCREEVVSEQQELAAISGALGDAFETIAREQAEGVAVAVVLGAALKNAAGALRHADAVSEECATIISECFAKAQLGAEVTMAAARYVAEFNRHQVEETEWRRAIEEAAAALARVAP